MYNTYIYIYSLLVEIYKVFFANQHLLDLMIYLESGVGVGILQVLIHFTLQFWRMDTTVVFRFCLEFGTIITIGRLLLCQIYIFFVI